MERLEKLGENRKGECKKKKFFVLILVSGKLEGELKIDGEGFPKTIGSLMPNVELSAAANINVGKKNEKVNINY